MVYDIEDYLKNQIEDNCKDPENYLKKIDYKENAENSDENTKPVTGSDLRHYALVRRHGGQLHLDSAAEERGGKVRHLPELRCVSQQGGGSQHRVQELG